MDLRHKVVVVTGGANGIGAAMARRFAAEGASGLVVADLDEARAREVAAEAERAGSQALAVRCDVGDEDQVRGLVAASLERFGHVDLFCSNAGVAFGKGVDAAAEDWDLAWRVNLLAHVFAARAVLPSMLARGAGYLLHTCSAAGLLLNPGDAPYTVSKHAAVAFAEWLAVTYGDQGVRISVICPMGVRTRMLLDGLEEGSAAARAVAAAGELLEPEQVAGAVVEGLAAERFLILPHPEVATHLRRKASDPDRWLAGMRRLVASAGSEAAGSSADALAAGSSADAGGGSPGASGAAAQRAERGGGPGRRRRSQEATP
jgi:NAD(P)-dependent dehydrogenase (short-subunit alcohol dehydrogenase family)